MFNGLRIPISTTVEKEMQEHDRTQPKDTSQTCFSVSKLPSSKSDLKRVFSKYVTVFGVDIVATSTVANQKIVHAANIMAQYLDNDADGQPDDSKVTSALKNAKATLVMFRDDREASRKFRLLDTALDNYAIQDLYGDEVVPDSRSLLNGGKRYQFDASLEEILHLLSDHGYATAYRSAFSTRSSRSLLAKAMTTAVGDCGYAHLNSLRWPKCKGIYHYDDDTCDMQCLRAEYFYWALTSVLGAQEYRCDDLSNEWEACTSNSVKEKNTEVYKLLTDPVYKLPTKLPNGRYAFKCRNGPLVG